MIIDHREQKLKDFFPDAEYKMLEHGDILINNYVIERKTIKDLISSIKDTRYSNQKKALLESYDVSNIIYIIEDYKKFANLDPMVKGAIINTQLRDKISVFLTKDITDTANLLKEIESRIDNHKVTENHIIKKTNNTYLNILCQIPGISNKTALVIIDKYPTLPNLLKNLSVLDIKLNKNVLDNLKNTFDE